MTFGTQQVLITTINHKNYKFTQKFRNNDKVYLASKLNEKSIAEDTIHNLDVIRITPSLKKI
jgi:hypothetical protein